MLKSQQIFKNVQKFECSGVKLGLGHFKINKKSILSWNSIYRTLKLKKLLKIKVS